MKWPETAAAGTLTVVFMPVLLFDVPWWLWWPICAACAYALHRAHEESCPGGTRYKGGWPPCGPLS